MKSKPEACIVVSGDPGRGFTFEGPFENRAEALRNAEQFAHDLGQRAGERGAWWIAPLQSPEWTSAEPNEPTCAQIRAADSAPEVAPR